MKLTSSQQIAAADPDSDYSPGISRAKLDDLNRHVVRYPPQIPKPLATLVLTGFQTRFYATEAEQATDHERLMLRCIPHMRFYYNERLGDYEPMKMAANDAIEGALP